MTGRPPARSAAQGRRRVRSTHRPRAVVFDPPPGRDYEMERAILARHGLDLVIPRDHATALQEAAQAHVLLVHRGPVGADLIPTLARCVGIVVYGIGVDAVDGEAARAAGIPVRGVPGYCSDEVADHALALVLALQRQVVRMATITGQGGWQDARPIGQLRRLRGQTLGVVGAGSIGRGIAVRARAFGFRTIACDPYATARTDPDLPFVTLQELMTASDVVVLSVPLTDETRDLISGETLEWLRPGSFLVNVARGAVVDEGALADALRSGRLAGAALDVRRQEPPEAIGDPLSGCRNLIVTPHQAASSAEAVADLKRGAALAAADLFATHRS